MDHYLKNNYVLHDPIYQKDYAVESPYTRDNIVKVTYREKEAFLWISSGKTKIEIGRILMVSESCIKRYCENIFFRFGAKDLPSAVAIAIQVCFPKLGINSCL